MGIETVKKKSRWKKVVKPKTCHIERERTTSLNHIFGNITFRWRESEGEIVRAGGGKGRGGDGYYLITGGLTFFKDYSHLEIQQESRTKCFKSVLINREIAVYFETLTFKF